MTISHKRTNVDTQMYFKSYVINEGREMEKDTCYIACKVQSRQVQRQRAEAKGKGERLKEE